MRVFPRCKQAEDGKHVWEKLPDKKRYRKRELNEKGWRVCVNCKIWSNRRTVKKLRLRLRGKSARKV